MVASSVGRALLAVSIAVAAAMLSGTAAAEDVQSVILSTQVNCPDALVSGVAANRIGAPLLLTDKGSLPAEASAQIEELSPATVYIIGGPAVVSEAVEDGLSADYSVVRLWGVTRYGTSAAVALQFWETAPKVMLVSGALGAPVSGRCELISDARDLAIQEDIPVMLIARDGIPEQVMEALGNLSTGEVILVGTVESGVTDTLESLGITVTEQIEGADDNETREHIRDKVKENLGSHGARPLVVVAVGNWSDTIQVPYLPNGTSRHISSEDQIDDLIAEIQAGNYTRIKIVGKPALAQVVYDRLAEEGINATLVSGRPAAVAARVMEAELAWIRERARAMNARLEALCERRSAYAEERFGDEYARVQAFIESSGLSEENKTRAFAWLDERKAGFDDAVENGSYCLAWEKYSAVKARISQLVFTYRATLVSAYQRLIDKESSIADDIQRLRNLTANIAEKLRNSRERPSAG